MTEHTPGPWEWQFAKAPDGIHHNALVHPNKQVILYEKPSKLPACSKADAKLIAASPDLLKKLKALVAWLEANDMHKTADGGVGTLAYKGTEYSEVSDAREAIANATE